MTKYTSVAQRPRVVRKLMDLLIRTCFMPFEKVVFQVSDGILV